MMLPLALVPFPVVLPLAVAAILLALGHLVPAVASKVVAIVAALAVAVLSLWLAVAAEAGTLVYWFGGWTPRPEVTLGIAFAIDPASGGFACFVALLFVASFVFAWGFFDEVSTTFHVMMLLFLAALQGFCLTRDLFNLFVWFEVMSVAAFALTGFTRKKSALAGALSFTICNSLASMCMLAGIGLLYARSGTLDFATMGAMIAKSGHDPVLVGGFCLVSTALLIKAAVVPFHFWLSDAHAVAPSPVSVIFSGCMVPSALFIWTKLLVQVFAGSPDVLSIVHGLLLTLGCVTAVVGGIMAWSQRHLKRLLAFSTISHIGIMMTGVASLAPVGLAGLMVYVVGHGLVKAALFMLVGVLLATRASVDELDLRGLGQGLFPAGLLTALAALLLGGAPDRHPARRCRPRVAGRPRRSRPADPCGRVDRHRPHGRGGPSGHRAHLSRPRSRSRPRSPGAIRRGAGEGRPAALAHAGPRYRAARPCCAGAGRGRAASRGPMGAAVRRRPRRHDVARGDRLDGDRALAGAAGDGRDRGLRALQAESAARLARVQRTSSSAP